MISYFYTAIIAKNSICLAVFQQHFVFSYLLCSPEGRKFRSKTELEAHIKECNLNVNISDFCFTVRGQHLLDLAASRDCNGRSYKRKRHSSQEAAIDGRLENTSSNAVDSSQPKRKRMRLWERPSENLSKATVKPVNFDSAVVNSKKESKKHESTNKLLNSHFLPVKEASGHKDKVKRVGKSPDAKPRRSASQKLTVRMKFKPLSSSSDSHTVSSSQSQISGRFCSAVDDTDILTSNDAAALSLSKLVSKQKQQSKQTGVMKSQVSAARSPASDRKYCMILPQPHAMNSDIQWIPPQSPFNLVEESLFHSSWKILVASIILDSGQGWLVSCVYHA